jgi:hypothetical protein
MLEHMQNFQKNVKLGGTRAKLALDAEAPEYLGRLKIRAG